MATPWYAWDIWELFSSGGFSSPDPVTVADSSWTIDVEFAPVEGSLYGRGSTYFAGGGGGWFGGGVIEYRTRNSDGSDTVHSVGASAPDGYVGNVWDSNVDSVTFGWIEGDTGWYGGRILFEIWI